MSDCTLGELRARSQLADEMIATLRRQIAELSRVVYAKTFSEETSRLRVENGLLEAEVGSLKAKLIDLESRNGVKQFSINEKVIPSGQIHVVRQEAASPKPQNTPAKVVAEEKKIKEQVTEKKQSAKNVQKGSKPVDQQAKSGGEKASEVEPDVGQLDLRVGLILNAKKHPDADSLYVEEVDLGEDRPRTVVSGLVKFVPLDQMQNRMAVLLCNLKPAKMRGVLSEAMVMCASTPDKVEILDPPQGSVPGDRVTCDNFPGEPEKQLNPKKKVFEQVAPFLKTDERCVATYKGSPLAVKDKGPVLAQTLKCVQIK